MHFTIEHIDNIVVLTLKNSTIETEVSAQLKAKILILAQPDIDALVIDMTMVNAIDSSGLGALLLANRQLDEFGIPVVISGVQDFVKSLMNMTRIDEVFEFYSDVEKAVTALKDKIKK